MAATALERRSAGTTRREIVSAASRLFYADGIHAVSADRVIAEAHVSKMTFYRHFSTKDDLVVAYLEAMSAVERGATAEARARFADDPAALVAWFGRVIAAQSCRPGFRGCAFINAAGEYPDATGPVREVVSRHRAWFRGVLVEVAGELGAARPDELADQLVVLRDGLLVSGYLGTRPESLAALFVDSVKSVVTTRR